MTATNLVALIGMDATTVKTISTMVAFIVVGLQVGERRQGASRTDAWFWHRVMMLFFLVAFGCLVFIIVRAIMGEW